MTRGDLARSVPERMADHAQQWREAAAERQQAHRDNPWQPEAADKSALRAGGRMEDHRPGARVEWDGREWQWSAWDGAGASETGSTPDRAAAIGSAQREVVALARQAGAPDDIFTRPPDRGAGSAHSEAVDPGRAVRDARTDPLDTGGLNGTTGPAAGADESDHDLGADPGSGPGVESDPGLES